MENEVRQYSKLITTICILIGAIGVLGGALVFSDLGITTLSIILGIIIMVVVVVLVSLIGKKYKYVK